MRYLFSTCLFALLTHVLLLHASEQQRIELQPTMVINESEHGSPEGMVDEQWKTMGPPIGEPDASWKINSAHNKGYPFSAHFDLGSVRHLSQLWIYDTNGKGDVLIEGGTPEAWEKLATYDCGAYKQWAPIQLDASTRYLRLTKLEPQANFSEIALYEYTPEGYAALQKRKEEEARREAEREAAIAKAMEEMKKRPLVDLGEPYGQAYLVDEIDLAAEEPGHEMREHPAGSSRVETILGKACRVLEPVKGEASYLSFRIGKMKLLQPGAAYVLEVEYPEDGPRTMAVANTGNETIRGFHTGLAVGDALHSKYVNSNLESLDMPLTNKWEKWQHYFHLHDRFPAYNKLPRGSIVRKLAPEDGFDVSICQFSAKNAPFSKGIAVSKIRLYAIPDYKALRQSVHYPPAELPHRRLFWREEMSDGVISPPKGHDQIGVTHRIDWFRYKAELMHLLGMNTFSKDLLEFGANQGWDPTPYGGNEWVYFNGDLKNLWKDIVQLMNEHNFEVFPYYEYSGSKGKKGLGNERRCKPLTRDDAFTHIKWIESANADITDPDTYTDFAKMLDLTVLQLRREADFAGIWLRPRNQLPMSFGDGALERFAKEANNGTAVKRADLINDKALYEQYVSWWHGKRRDFLVAMRQHLIDNGLEDPVVLFTGCAAEPGVSLRVPPKVLVTDRPDLWEPIMAKEEHFANDEPQVILTPEQVREDGLYAKAVRSPVGNWGNWEWHHASPANDPDFYKETEGVLLSHAVNRSYTVNDPKSLEAFRSPAGLAILRHYPLNENMMFDKGDNKMLGYFVADMERAGPYCMMNEALAMANGAPNMIGYLAGNNFGRGFAKYVRNFNAAYLSLPALPSTVLEGVSADPDIVVRSITTGEHGIWYALVNTSRQPKQGVAMEWPAAPTSNAATGEAVETIESLDFYPYELKSFHVAP